MAKSIENMRRCVNYYGNDAKEFGYKSYSLFAACHNPYESGSAARVAWLAGWVEAQSVFAGRWYD